MADDRPPEPERDAAPWEPEDSPETPEPGSGGTAPLGRPDPYRAAMPTGPLPPVYAPGVGPGDPAGGRLPPGPGAGPPAWPPTGATEAASGSPPEGPGGPPRELWLALGGVLAIVVLVMLLLVSRGPGAPLAGLPATETPGAETWPELTAAAATSLAALATATLTAIEPATPLPPSPAPPTLAPPTPPPPTLAPPVAVIAAPLAGQVGQPLRFSAARSSSGAPITGFLWDFGDGGRSLGSDVDHAFALPGTYTVLLTITDVEGRQALARHTLAIEASPQRPPSAVIAGPASGRVGQVLTFDAAASQAGSAPIVRYTWRFGDGQISQGQVVSHSYSQPGIYQVVVDVVDAEGLWASASLEVTIASLTPPKAVILAPSAARVGEILTFDGSRSTSGSPIVTYLWQFGDGRATDAVVAKYAFDTPDRYTVTLTIVDGTGARDTASQALTVEGQAASGPQAVITGPSSVNAGESTSFSGKSSRPGASPIVRYDWIVGGPGGRGSGSGVTFNHTFPTPGTYVVMLLVTDQRGLAAAESIEVAVR